MNATWSKVLKRCADPERAAQCLETLAEGDAGPTLAAASEGQASLLAALFSGSVAMSSVLVAHPEWIGLLTPEALKFPRRDIGLRTEVDRWLRPFLKNRDYAAALRQVRLFKQREMVRIAARDLGRSAGVEEITREISDVADICLATVWQVCFLQLSERHGIPYHQDAEGRWHPTAGCLLGMGKLGGQELNYSSDVDVLFVYSEEGGVFKPGESQDHVVPKSVVRTGTSTARKTGLTAGTTRPLEKSLPTRAGEGPPPGTQTGMNSHQFFNRLAEAVIMEVTRMAPEGMLYRIDLRLRPEGDAGPLSRSLPSYENYYAQWGQTWERMMLIKARGVAGDDGLAAEFLETIQPFRYPRSTNQGVLAEIAAMKDRIENEVVKAGELDRNVKLGRGGIREIEFVAQSLQLLHGGRQPFLQGAQTLPCLKKLVQYELLSGEDCRVLQEAYRFLRDVEHRLQMEDNRQTHTIPPDRKGQGRLARLMGFKDSRDFERARRVHTEGVRRIFDKTLKSDAGKARPASAFPTQFEGAESKWKTLLSEHDFKEPDKAFRVLREFVEGPGYIHVSPRTSSLAYQLLPKLFALCRKSTDGSPIGGPALIGTGSGKSAPLSDPDRVVTRLDSFISAYGARGTLFELWNSNPTLFELLLLLFDRSEFLAELAIRTPDLVDELVTSGRLRQRKRAEETLRDLRHGAKDEDQHLWLRRYHQAELMRIGLRDILGLADFEQYLTELSALADACLQYSLEVVMRRHRVSAPPFAIVGLGKLGGAEIDYGSDLDILFVADSKAKRLPHLAAMAAEVMDLVSRRTEQGILFHTDARLRPDGEKGLLVNTLKAYEDYYRHRALLWEIQSLTRTRTVAGDRGTGAEFHDLATALTNFQLPSQDLCAFTPDWKQKIHQMRMRIEKERTPRGKDELAIKTGTGGLIDAEFVAQILALGNGWPEANTLQVLERGVETGVLPDGEKLIANYRRLRRVEGILRRWSYEGETVLPDDPAPYYRVSVRCGFESPERFKAALADWRREIREVYLKVVGS